MDYTAGIRAPVGLRAEPTVARSRASNHTAVIRPYVAVSATLTGRVALGPPEHFHAYTVRPTTASTVSPGEKRRVDRGRLR